jgi:hypothetical protein
MLNGWQMVRLTLTGMTWEEIPIYGQDCVRVMWKTRGPHGGDSNEPGAPAITEVILDIGYPGTFVSGTQITFGLPQPAYVTLSIFDVAGRRIKTLVNEAMPDGIHTVVWNGKDDAGTSVASGVYFVKMSAPGIDKAAKMIVVE